MTRKMPKRLTLAQTIAKAVVNGHNSTASETDTDDFTLDDFSLNLPERIKNAERLDANEVTFDTYGTVTNTITDEVYGVEITVTGHWDDADPDVGFKGGFTPEKFVVVSNDSPLSDEQIQELASEYHYFEIELRKYTRAGTPEDLPANYPEFEVPASEQTLRDLYGQFNIKYFGGELPEYRLRFAPLATRFLGKHHIKLKGSQSYSRVITIAKSIINSRKLIVDTMLHEMIHAWQYVQFSKTEDDKYLDLSWFDPKGEQNLRGHGKYFHEEMGRINSYGFDLNVTSDLPDEVELVDAFYILIFTSSKDKERCIFLYTLLDPKPHLEKIVGQIDGVAGQGFMDEYILATSTATAAMLGTRLTKSFNLPKNHINLFYDFSAVESHILRNPLTAVLTKEQLESQKGDAGGLPPEVTQLLHQFHKHRGNDFRSYLISVFMNITPLKPLARHIPTKYTPADGPIKEIPDALVQGVWEDWEGITDIEIKNSFFVGKLVSDLKWAIRRGEPSKDTYSYYWKDFAPRVDKTRFRSVLLKALDSQLRKDAKKAEREPLVLNPTQLDKLVATYLPAAEFLQEHAQLLTGVAINPNLAYLPTLTSVLQSMSAKIELLSENFNMCLDPTFDRLSRDIYSRAEKEIKNPLELKEDNITERSWFPLVASMVPLSEQFRLKLKDIIKFDLIPVLKKMKEKDPRINLKRILDPFTKAQIRSKIPKAPKRDWNEL